MRVSFQIWVRSAIYVVSSFFISVAVAFAKNPQQFEILGPLPPVLFTVQLVLEYLPSAGLFVVGAVGFYIASMNWEKKRDELGAGTENHDRE